MMLDHIGLAVRDFGRSRSFFRRALAPLAAGGHDNGAPGNIEAVCHTPE